jgi:hypothetical protein
MKYYIKFGIWLMLGIPTWVFSNSTGSYWQCTTHDNTNKTWVAINNYQKMALNIAFDVCKKESQFPKTCKTSNRDCEGFINGVSTKPYWHCTALDQTAAPWQSDYYSDRDDAALGAKAFCKNYSSVPDTCYVNFITCININAGY